MPIVRRHSDNTVPSLRPNSFVEVAKPEAVPVRTDTRRARHRREEGRRPRR